MKHKLRIGLAVGVIFLLMLVTVPMVSGEEILYPIEEGPYTVLINGNCTGIIGGLITFWHKIPLWFLLYPRMIGYYFVNDSVFFVNGERQDILYPAEIELLGFKGYGQTLYMFLLTEFVASFIYKLTGVLHWPEAQVGGLCAEILVIDSR